MGVGNCLQSLKGAHVMQPYWVGVHSTLPASYSDVLIYINIVIVLTKIINKETNKKN